MFAEPAQRRVRKPVVKNVYNSAENFHGSRHSFPPDTIETWSDEPPPAKFILPARYGEDRDDTGPRGHHRSEGFMITPIPSRNIATEHSVDAAR